MVTINEYCEIEGCKTPGVHQSKDVNKKKWLIPKGDTHNVTMIDMTYLRKIRAEHEAAISDLQDMYYHLTYAVGMSDKDLIKELGGTGVNKWGYFIEHSLWARLDAYLHNTEPLKYLKEATEIFEGLVAKHHIIKMRDDDYRKRLEVMGIKYPKLSKLE